MKNSTLEITDNAYHLKLSKDDFDLSFINQLIKGIQARELFFNSSAYPDYEGDIISRNNDNTSGHDRLEEK